MSVVVFCGPTIDAPRVRAALPQADCRPPACQGDIHAAARADPEAIALIDGEFLDVPSVWHREILAALDAGIPVWGAASMGALRAAECADFGMIAVGKIAEAYRCGRYPRWDEPFEDDDEVAVTHGPPEIGAPPLSDAMVDLRETLARAEAAGTIDRPARDALAARMKSLHFSDRSHAALSRAATGMLGRDRSAALAAHRCSQKREDAEALLAALARPAPRAAPQPWTLERTIDWERFAAAAPPPPLTDAERRALAGLAADAALERSLRRRAAARLAALDRAAPADAKTAMTAFRHDRGLLSRAGLDGWIQENAVPAPDFTRLLADEAALETLAGRCHPDRLARAMLDELRLDGRFAALAAEREAPT